ncbi:MAG: diversity-generating retroelement protein bAvd family protein, partial [Dysgonamonadaceae bacterium]|nr:diversity-generating retroelement protein bAvd family protein [Dysgonamonadaceae bacterium]
MATYDNLPVYKQTYDLLLQLFRVCQNMERDYKFTLGENLKKEVITLIINVYRANCRENKEKYLMLQGGRENVEVVRLLLRLLQDLKQIGLN